MPRVFVTSNRMRKDSVTKELRPIVDLRPAEQYGQLVSIFDHDMEPSNQTDMAAARSRLTDFDPFDDFILPNGSPVATLAAGLILGEKQMPEVQVLVWDRIYLKYILTVVEL